MDSLQKFEATYKAEVLWEQSDLLNQSMNVKSQKWIKKWTLILPTWKLIIYTDNLKVFKALRIRNFKVEEETEYERNNNNMSIDYQGELFFIKNVDTNPIAYRDDQHNIWMIYWNDVFEPWVVTGFASYLWAKERNIINPVFVHWSLVEILDTNWWKKSIILAGAHWSGKSYATFNTLAHIKTKYPDYKVTCKWDDWYILRTWSDWKVYATTTDSSIALDRNLFENKKFIKIFEDNEEKIYKDILNNSEIKKYIEEKMYNVEIRQQLPKEHRKWKILNLLKTILRDTSNSPKQLNIFYDIKKLVKKISLSAEITANKLEQKDTKQNMLHNTDESIVDSIIVLYPNFSVRKITDISDMAGIIVEWATNHYPLTQNELPTLINTTKQLLEIFHNKPLVYNYKNNEDFDLLLHEVLQDK